MMSQRVPISLPGGDNTCSVMFVHSSKTILFFVPLKTRLSKSKASLLIVISESAKSIFMQEAVNKGLKSHFMDIDIVGELSCEIVNIYLCKYHQIVSTLHSKKKSLLNDFKIE